MYASNDSDDEIWISLRIRGSSFEILLVMSKVNLNAMLFEIGELTMNNINNWLMTRIEVIEDQKIFMCQINLITTYSFQI
jgi:hypothetical protein